MHGLNTPPSDWLTRWAALLPVGGSVLDLACGAGRHLRWLHQRGYKVTGVDRDAAALAPLRQLAGADIVCADIENGPWPLAGRQFDAVLVTHYLWRPLLPFVRDSVAPGGLLIYETFAYGQQTLGRPSRPDFLLQPGELLRHAEGLRILGYEDGFLSQPPRFIQRIVARRPAAAADESPLWRALPEWPNSQG